MKVDSENMVPSSIVSVSPIFTFSFSFSWGQNCRDMSVPGFKRKVRRTAYLEDVGPSTGNTASNGLDEARDLAHNVDAIEALAERTVDLGGDILTVGGLAGPGPLDGGGLGPLALGILLRGSVGAGVIGTGIDDLAVLQETTDVNLGRTVGGGSGELHHDGGEGGGLEVDEVPAGSFDVISL